MFRQTFALFLLVIEFWGNASQAFEPKLHTNVTWDFGKIGVSAIESSGSTLGKPQNSNPDHRRERFATQITGRVFFYPQVHKATLEFAPTIFGEFRILSQLENQSSFGNTNYKGSGVLAGIGIFSQYREEYFLGISYDFFGWHAIHDPETAPSVDASIRFTSVRGFSIFAGKKFSKDFYLLLSFCHTKFRSLARSDVTYFLGDEALSKTTFGVGTSFVY